MSISRPVYIKSKHVACFVLGHATTKCLIAAKQKRFKMTEKMDLPFLVNLQNQDMPLLILWLKPHDKFQHHKNFLPSSKLMCVCVALATQNVYLVITVSNKKEKARTGNRGCTEGVCRHVEAQALAFVVPSYLSAYWHTVYRLETRTLCRRCVFWFLFPLVEDKLNCLRCGVDKEKKHTATEVKVLK